MACSRCTRRTTSSIELAEGHGEGGLLESRWKYVPLVVLGLAIVMESLSFRTAIIETNKVRGDHSWWAFIRRAKAPELPVILLEDLAALLGLAVAFAGVGLALLTHNLYFDVVGSAVIGALLVTVAVILGIEVKSQLARRGGHARGGRPHPRRDRVHARRRAASSTSRRCTSLRRSCSSPRRSQSHQDATAADVAATIDAAERALRAAEPMATQVFLEPDIHRDDYVPDERPEIPEAPGH